MSEPQTIFQIFAAAKKEVRAVGKDQRNLQQNFNFRGVDAVVNAAAPALDKYGVITTPMLDEIDYATVEVGQKRTPMAHVRVKVTYRFLGPAGDHFDALVPGEAMDSGDKATAKAMSVAYRIALIQALNLPTSDEDPDSKTYERSSRESFDDARPASSRQADGNGNSASARQESRQAQRMASVPSDDPWYGAAPPDVDATDGTERSSARPDPAAPKAPESDPEWLDLIGTEIDGIESRDDGTKVFAHLVAAFNNGTCTPDDRRALEPLIKAKGSAVMNQQAATQGAEAA